MQAQLNQNPALMGRCRGNGMAAARKGISELLDEVRITHPSWFAAFEDAHLSVVASADLLDVVELIATAPGGPDGRLAGFIEGLYANN